MTKTNTKRRPTTKAPPNLKEFSCVQKSSSRLSCSLTFSPRLLGFANLGALWRGWLSVFGTPAVNTASLH